jgi:hypothetical protein
MTKVTKLGQVLALTQDGLSRFKNLLDDYTKFMRNSQGAFLGHKHTYTPSADTIDVPEKRSYVNVVTTVSEKLKYFEDTTKPFIDNLFTKEKTNSSNVAFAELVVEGVNFGKLSSLELLALKGFLESATLKAMYESIPVRSDAETWLKSQAEAYRDREVFEKEIAEFPNKTTIKESYILVDPNVEKNKGLSYTPVKDTKDTQVVLGIETKQQFSGQWSQTQRAELLRRLSTMKDAVVAALHVANNVEIIPSELTADKIFGYLHHNKK